MTAPAASAPASAPALTDRAFARYRELIYRQAGIALSDNKRALLVGRLARRLRELDIDSYDAYLDRALNDADEMVRLLDAICTNETQFFREPRQFELLGNQLCTGWMEDAAAGRRSKHVRVWSAACSTGEEPYSIAMLLHDKLGRHGWTIDILASDLSTRALDGAKRAVWPIARTRNIPDHLLRTYVLRGVGALDGQAKASLGLRELVRFARINLRETTRWPVHEKFDAIFCRNVMIYFDAPTRHETIGALLRHLAPGGYLFLGHAESLIGTSHKLEPVMPAVYRMPRLERP